MRPTVTFRTLFSFVIIAAASAAFSSQAYGQGTRTRTAPPQNEVRAAAEAVSIQIKNMTKFLFVLGGVAKGIDDLDKEIKAGRATRELEAKNQEFKDDVIRSVRAMRTGLVNIERDFIAKPQLRQYLSHVRGISEDSAIAEDLALAGNFNASGRQLLLILERLSDVLVELP
ncbi:MAG: hypothetical protein IPM63_15300 [Acidobacteriota bacterium]|nr:MAG: hypothetical protein IPM63_15300 [Acidobacteriota bacterium]